MFPEQAKAQGEMKSTRHEVSEAIDGKSARDWINLICGVQRCVRQHLLRGLTYNAVTLMWLPAAWHGVSIVAPARASCRSHAWGAMCSERTPLRRD
jgi:hypothetical protein